jgi:hypothetical protein
MINTVERNAIETVMEMINEQSFAGVDQVTPVIALWQPPPLGRLLREATRARRACVCGVFCPQLVQLDADGEGSG